MSNNEKKTMIHQNNVSRVNEDLADAMIKATREVETEPYNVHRTKQAFHKLLPSYFVEFICKQLFQESGYVILFDLPEFCCNLDSFVVGLTSLCSYPIFYPGEGELVIRIKARIESPSYPSFANSDEFHLHTDLSYVPVPPDILTMVVKNTSKDGGGLSIFSSLAMIQDLLSEDILKQLTLPKYRFAVPTHYKATKHESENRFPIIKLSNARPQIRFRHDIITADDMVSANALSSFRKIAQENATEILMPKNSCVLINQHFVLHGRRKFTPTYLENDRELLRCYGTTNLGQFNHINYETGEIGF